MESTANTIEPLLERVKDYGKTSFELFKLKALDKSADVLSTLASRFVLGMIIAVFAITFNIGVALWLGYLLGKNYYGFLLVAAFYGIIGIIVCLMQQQIKARFNNSIIKQILN